MTRQAISLCIGVLLLLGVHAYTDAEDSEEFSSEAPRDVARDQLLDSITEDYLQLLDYEMSQCKELFEKVLDDERFLDVRSEILLGKKIILSDFVEHINERQLKEFPERVHRPARFFHMFGNSLLFKEFIGIIARLEPRKSRYDRWIEEALMENGLADVVNKINQKRTGMINESVRKIEQYVSGLNVEQRRKAVAQKLTDWSLKMKKATKLEEKMEYFREFLRYEYLETTSMLD